jgi:hypothetical protein
MRRLTGLALASLLLSLVAGPSAAVTLNVVGGELVGASGVDVGGTLYDVAFVGGTCASLFSGCDELSDFTFQAQADALAAAQALLDQVFVDGGAGNFDSNPELTAGCSESTHCFLYTPFSALPNNTSAYAANFSPSAGDPDDVGLAVTGTMDTSSSTADAWAVWTAAPEPTAPALLCLGLAGLTARRRRLH